ncbi:MAG: hypothetical protein ABI298_06375 [Acidimicrobiales bacterium]
MTRNVAANCRYSGNIRLMLNEPHEDKPDDERHFVSFGGETP